MFIERTDDERQRDRFIIEYKELLNNRGINDPKVIGQVCQITDIYHIELSATRERMVEEARLIAISYFIHLPAWRRILSKKVRPPTALLNAATRGTALAARNMIQCEIDSGVPVFLQEQVGHAFDVILGLDHEPKIPPNSTPTP